LQSEIESFFSEAFAERTVCDAKAKELAGRERVNAVKVQGVYSYTVYAGLL